MTLATARFSRRWAYHHLKGERSIYLQGHHKTSLILSSAKPAQIENEDMKTLTRDIAARLRERPFCVVFEDDLERCWPSDKMAEAKREREIQNFAESQGWIATILEGAFGTRAIFRRL